MKIKLAAILVVSSFFLGSFCLLPNAAVYAAEKKDVEMEKALWLYGHEDYDEAYVLLKDLREKRRDSSLVAYYLGMTCKQMQNYREAESYLVSAVTLRPKVKEALVELIDLLYKIDKLQEAKKWIKVAEEESAYPAQVAFLKGLVLLKEGEDTEGAIESFKEAESLDEALTQNCDYYIGLAYVQSKQLKEAKKVFREVVTQGPNTGLATFSGQYLDAINRKQEAKRILRGSAGAAVQYDSNVLLQPAGTTLAVGIGNKSDWRQVYTGNVEANIYPKDFFSLKAGYSFYYAKQTDLGFYDTVTHNIYAQPSFYMGNVALNIPTYYQHVGINDKNYLSTGGVGLQSNIKLGRNHMAQAAFNYRRENYLWGSPVPEDNRDSNEYFWNIGWYYFFGNNKGVAHMKYTFNIDDTNGANYRYIGNRFTVQTAVPLTKKLSAGTTIDFFVQDFFFKQNSVYKKKRKDTVFTATAFLGYEVFKNCEVQLNYIYVSDVSNIGIYKYTRDIYSMGIRYKF
ncbi:MAG: DUF560 domain-containing protein [Candidatus Omnitrophica bacterium]|nr:DUF560 domain-containing protein [Candidatus Omnitrophota bacterium]